MYDRLREEAAGASGAVLGFIGDDIRGAIKGYHIGKKLAQFTANRMPPTPKTPNRTGRFIPYKTPISSDKIRRIVSRRKPVGRILRKNQISAGITKVTARRVKKQLLKKKRVKVSRKLRAKINKVLSGQIFGEFQETGYQVLRLIGSEDFKQIIVRLACTGDSSDPLFSPNRILDAASVLWNEKAHVDNPKTIVDAGNFDPKKLKCTVINSSAMYYMKNNTQRTITIKMMEITPRSNVLPASKNPFQQWIDDLNQDALNNGPNQNNAALTVLHTNPSMLPEFRKTYRMHTTKIVIPPGGEYEHFIQGPQDQLYDFQKMWTGSDFNNYQKFSKWVLAVYYPDLVCTSLGGYGRYLNSGTEAANLGVVIETRYRYKISMPELAGFYGNVLVTANPAVGAPVVNNTSVQLGQRQYSYALKTFALSEIVGVETRVDEQNPFQVQNPVN